MKRSPQSIALLAKLHATYRREAAAYATANGLPTCSFHTDDGEASGMFSIDALLPPTHPQNDYRDADIPPTLRTPRTPLDAAYGALCARVSP